MMFFNEILNCLISKYLFDTSIDSCYNTRTQSNSEIAQFCSRTKSFSNNFSPSCIKEWSKLNAKIRNLPFAFRFKKSLLIYFKTDKNSVFDVHNPIRINPLNSLRLNFSHLNGHKFCHNFRDTVNSLCLCNTETETVSRTISCVALCFLNKERNSLNAPVILTIFY